MSGALVCGLGLQVTKAPKKAGLEVILVVLEESIAHLVPLAAWDGTRADRGGSWLERPELQYQSLAQFLSGVPRSVGLPAS